LPSDNPPNGWAIVTAPGITANGSAPLGPKWTVPVRAGVTNVTAIGRPPVSSESAGEEVTLSGFP
jgi:hypothetical protein